MVVDPGSSRPAIDAAPATTATATVINAIARFTP
jgi:hypothetical protein